MKIIGMMDMGVGVLSANTTEENMAKLSNEDLSDLITKINRTSETLDYCRSKLEKADTEEIVVPEWILRAVTVLIKRASTFNVALIDRLGEQKKRQN